MQLLSNELLIGSANVGKNREIEAALRDLRLTLHTLLEYSGLAAPAEGGDTYQENALLKAAYYNRHTGLLTLADDSGLEVEHLNGEPGVFTARFGGSDLSDDRRIEYLLEKLNNTANRRARFVCVIALVGPQIVKTVKGECSGTIATKARGRNGFGYDPIFIPSGHSQTFAELPGTLKETISHRAKALAEARKVLMTLSGICKE